MSSPAKLPSFADIYKSIDSLVNAQSTDKEQAVQLIIHAAQDRDVWAKIQSYSPVLRPGLALTFNHSNPFIYRVRQQLWTADCLAVTPLSKDLPLLGHDYRPGIAQHIWEQEINQLGLLPCGLRTAHRRVIEDCRHLDNLYRFRSGTTAAWLEDVASVDDVARKRTTPSSETFDVSRARSAVEATSHHIRAIKQAILFEGDEYTSLVLKRLHTAIVSFQDLLSAM